MIKLKQINITFELKMTSITKRNSFNNFNFIVDDCIAHNISKQKVDADKKLDSKGVNRNGMIIFKIGTVGRDDLGTFFKL